jgi:hypothetical protein
MNQQHQQMSPIDEPQFEKYFNKAYNNNKANESRKNTFNNSNKNKQHNFQNANSTESNMNNQAFIETNNMSPKPISSNANLRSSSTNLYQTPPPQAQAIHISTQIHNQSANMQPIHSPSSHHAAMAVYNATLHQLAANIQQQHLVQLNKQQLQSPAQQPLTLLTQLPNTSTNAIPIPNNNQMLPTQSFKQAQPVVNSPSNLRPKSATNSHLVTSDDEEVYPNTNSEAESGSEKQKNSQAPTNNLIGNSNPQRIHRKSTSSSTNEKQVGHTQQQQQLQQRQHNSNSISSSTGTLKFHNTHSSIPSLSSSPASASQSYIETRMFSPAPTTSSIKPKDSAQQQKNPDAIQNEKGGKGESSGEQAISDSNGTQSTSKSSPNATNMMQPIQMQHQLPPMIAPHMHGFNNGGIFMSHGHHHAPHHPHHHMPQFIIDNQSGGMYTLTQGGPASAAPTIQILPQQQPGPGTGPNGAQVAPPGPFHQMPAPFGMMHPPMHHQYAMPPPPLYPQNQLLQPVVPGAQPQQQQPVTQPHFLIPIIPPISQNAQQNAPQHAANSSGNNSNGGNNTTNVSNNSNSNNSSSNLNSTGGNSTNGSSLNALAAGTAASTPGSSPNPTQHQVGSLQLPANGENLNASNSKSQSNTSNTSVNNGSNSSNGNLQQMDQHQMLPAFNLHPMLTLGQPASNPGKKYYYK